ncbi:MAG: endonuclease/exonuclease/phosphatase, partial [Sediminibacterium sp.]
MKILLLITLLVFTNHIKSQTIIAFYNLENFYDTIDNPITTDEEFTPSGIKKYGTHIYTDKIFHLATVLSSIGSHYDARGPALIGVAEIENDTVLYDLKNHFLLRERNYQFIHFDSRDARGVDVALFYRPQKFIPIYRTKLMVALPGGAKEAYFTRDILYVKGLLEKDTLHVFVNHWPSRRGGEERSAPAREAAAAVCRKTVDSIQHIIPDAAIIIMGDLNDNPSDKSIR